MGPCARLTTSGEPAGHGLLGRSGPGGRQPTGEASTSSGGSGRQLQPESPGNCARGCHHLQHRSGSDARERVLACCRRRSTSGLGRERHRCCHAEQVRPGRSGRLRARQFAARGRPRSPPRLGPVTHWQWHASRRPIQQWDARAYAARSGSSGWARSSGGPRQTSWRSSTTHCASTCSCSDTEARAGPRRSPRCLGEGVREVEATAAGGKAGWEGAQSARCGRTSAAASAP
jgi:hypothetical protein